MSSSPFATPGRNSHLFDTARLRAIRELNPERADESDVELSRLVRFAADLLDVPFAYVNLLDDRCQFHLASTVENGHGAGGSSSSLDTSLCRYVVAAEEPILLEDAGAFPELDNHPAIAEHGLRAYAGVPLRDAAGRVVGTLCVADLQRRAWSDRTLEILQQIAGDAEGWIETRRRRMRRRDPPSPGGDAPGG